MEEFVTLPCVGGDEREARVLDVTEVVALEQRIASEGTSLLELMTRAGTALAQAVEKATVPEGRVVVLAGSETTEATDGLASRLAEAGRNVALATKSAHEGLGVEPARTAAIDAMTRGGFGGSGCARQAAARGGAG